VRWKQRQAFQDEHLYSLMRGHIMYIKTVEIYMHVWPCRATDVGYCSRGPQRLSSRTGCYSKSRYTVMLRMTSTTTSARREKLQLLHPRSWMVKQTWRRYRTPNGGSRSVRASGMVRSWREGDSEAVLCGNGMYWNPFRWEKQNMLPKRCVRKAGALLCRRFKFEGDERRMEMD